MKIENGTVYNPPFPKNYAPEFLILEEGKGVYLTDAAGQRYLDFGSGIAVNALGYGREDLAKTAYDQMMKVVHVSNLYTTRPAIELASRMTADGRFAAVHLGNSGTEANEAAIKYARLYSLRKKGPGRHKLLSLEHAFHGRTLGALSVTPTAAYREPYEPLIPGCETTALNDVEALRKRIDDTYAGVLVEVIQGEGGLAAMTKEFARELRILCTKFDVILIADEVQTGMGRTGSFFASDQVGLEPDIITLAKPLAGGLPLSATLLPSKVNDLIKPGDHGTTFGGGPVTTAVACRVWDIIHDEKFLEDVRRKGELLENLLSMLKTDDLVKDLRGAGLLRGIVLDDGKSPTIVKDFIAEARSQGLLVLRSGSNVVRIAPPLVIGDDDLRKGTGILASVLKAVGTKL